MTSFADHNGCSTLMANAGLPNPRTCRVCKLGPCRYGATHKVLATPPATVQHTEVHACQKAGAATNPDDLTGTEWGMLLALVMLQRQGLKAMQENPDMYPPQLLMAADAGVEKLDTLARKIQALAK